jgi:hypothetical protein
MRLIDRIRELEVALDFLLNKVEDLSKNTEQKLMGSTTIVGGIENKGLLSPVDISTGLGPVMGNGVIWNDGELDYPPINAEAPTPTKGYNKHTHSRYSGGALIKQNLEIVEYDPTWFATITNKHSQQFWQTNPIIATEVNTNKQTVEKIGCLDLVFNPDTLTWGTTAYEIDIRKCYFVSRDENGDIELDSKGKEKKSPLFNTDQTKTSIIWDEDSQVFRLYAVYSPGTPSGE